jgi:hypothetical protein
MVGQEGFPINRVLLFDGKNYAFWSIRMQTYLMSFGFDIWKSFMNGYTSPKTPPTYVTGKNPSENNAKAMNAILCSLSESKFDKVVHYESKKYI